jgi:ankyrin repeat protein
LILPYKTAVISSDSHDIAVDSIIISEQSSEPAQVFVSRKMSSASTTPLPASSINAQGGSEGTTLQAASANGNRDVVQLLLDNGADINTQDKGEYGTALQAASDQGNRDVIQLLLDKDAI